MTKEVALLHLPVPVPDGFSRWTGVITIIVIILYILVMTGAQITLGIGPAQ